MANSQRLTRRSEADEEKPRQHVFLEGRLAVFVTLAFFSRLLVLAKLYAASQNRILVLTGHAGELIATEMDGHYYIDIEALTRLANGSLNCRGNQIVLILSVPSINTPASNSTASQSGQSGFSKESLRAGIEEMSVIREWWSALINANCKARSNRWTDPLLKPTHNPPPRLRG